MISCALPSEGLISTIGRHTTPLGICDGDGKFLGIIELAVAFRAPSKRSDAEMFVFRDGKLIFSILESQ